MKNNGFILRQGGAAIEEDTLRGIGFFKKFNEVDKT